MTDSTRDRMARAICPYIDEIPDVATNMQRKMSTRDFVDKAEVWGTVEHVLAEMERPGEGVIQAGIDAAEGMYRQQYGDGWKWGSPAEEAATKIRLGTAMLACLEAIREGK